MGSMAGASAGAGAEDGENDMPSLSAMPMLRAQKSTPTTQTETSKAMQHISAHGMDLSNMSTARDFLLSCPGHFSMGL